MLRIGEGFAPWTWEEIEKFRAEARTDLWWAAAAAVLKWQAAGESGQTMNENEPGL